MDIKKDINENNIIVLIISNKKYSAILEDTVKALASAYSKLCYTSLNKPYDKLLNEFKKNNIDAGKFFFIDCVSEKISTGKNVLYVSSPRSLTELNITINKVLDAGDIQLTIFDSLSTLLAYEGSMTVIKFLHSIISAFRTYGSKCIFTCMKDDVNADIIKDLKMFADKVVEVG